MASALHPCPRDHRLHSPSPLIVAPIGRALPLTNLQTMTRTATVARYARIYAAAPSI